LISNCWDIILIMNTIDHFLQQNKHDSIALNLSCGTKPMAIAAQKVFSKYQKPIFYVNEKTDDLVFFSEDNETHTELIQLNDILNLQDYLLSFGIKVNQKYKEVKVTKDTMLICSQLIEHIEYFKKSLILLNGYAYKATSKLKIDIAEKDFNNKQFKDLIDLFVQANFCSLKGKELSFTNQENRFFCNGGWLEEYVFGIVKNLQQYMPIQDVAMGIEVLTSNQSKNEIDVAFIANNRFFMIECKTQSYHGYKKKQATNIMYKLDTLKDYAGVRTKAMLVSFYDIPLSNFNRAKDYDIHIVDFNKLKNLENLIINWIENE